MKTRTANACLLAILASTLLFASPDVMASTGAGGLSGLVDDLKEILTTWFAQGLMYAAFAFAVWQLGTKFDYRPMGSVLMVALVLNYGPDFLISLTGAVI